MQTYTAHELELAVKMINEEGLSIRKAAKHYSIPRSTLTDRMNGKIAMDAKPGRKPAVPAKIEDLIVQQTIEASSKGFGISRRQLCTKTGHVAKRLNLQTPFK